MLITEGMEEIREVKEVEEASVSREGEEANVCFIHEQALGGTWRLDSMEGLPGHFMHLLCPCSH